jgi:multiple sugar transport system permease protein
MLKQWLAGGARFGILAVFVTFTAFPFYWMLITAFKQTHDLLNPKNNPFLFNLPPTFEHVRVLFTDTMFAQWLLNTAMVGVLVVGITLLLAVPAGYSLARLTGHLGTTRYAIFLTYLVPPTHPVHSPVAGDCHAQIAGFAVVAGAGVSEFYCAVLYLVADGVFQGHSA